MLSNGSSQNEFSANDYRSSLKLLVDGPGIFNRSMLFRFSPADAKRVSTGVVMLVFETDIRILWLYVLIL